MLLTRRFFTGASVLSTATVILTLGVAQAQPWTSFDTKTRYLAMGDSLSAGYGAMPATRGFTYDLYESGVIDHVWNTLLCDMAVPGALSQDVLAYQVPQVQRFFKSTGHEYPQVITLTVGGNDMLAVLDGADPAVVLKNLAANLYAILGSLHKDFPSARIYLANMYDPKLDVPGENQLVLMLNQTIATVVQAFPANAVTLVDVYSAFQGKKGLLLSDFPHADPGQIHPSNAGYRVMAREFAEAIGKD